jgi:hypothetical protein
LGVNQGTARLMKHKLMRAMAAREAAKPPGAVERLRSWPSRPPWI